MFICVPSPGSKEGFLLQGSGVKAATECVWAGAAGPTDLGSVSLGLGSVTGHYSESVMDCE